MKRTLLIIVIALIWGSSLAQQSTKKILFIGNSYTYVNDLPQTTQTMATVAEVLIIDGFSMDMNRIMMWGIPK